MPTRREQRQQSRPIRGRWLGLTALVLALAIPAHAVEPGGYVVLYDPDASSEDAVELVVNFSRFFDGLGSKLGFKAAQQLDDFERLLSDPKTHYVMVASSYLRSNNRGLLVPLLVPAVQNDVYYRKLLVSHGSVTTAALSGKNIAATGVLDEDSAQTTALTGVLVNHGITKSLIMSVPKDLDALMALQLRQVQAALVTPGSLDVLRRINPAAAAELRVLFETRKILRSPFCAVKREGLAQEQAEVVEALRQMHTSAVGRTIMQYLEFDAWVKFDPEMLRK